MTETTTAAELDAADPLAAFRDEFALPEGVYFVGNSLGAMPKAARDHLIHEIDRWAEMGVEGHFNGETAWKDMHQLLAPPLGRLVGAGVDEVVAMNTLTVNLHLLMISFYRPTPERHKILIEDHAFPSDHFAVESQIRQRGYDPAQSLVVVSPREGDETLTVSDILAAIDQHGDELALVLLPGVQYYTGQVLPMEEITTAGHAVGATVGFDLAHAIGNIPMQLHDWGVDFAAWCTYKYLNSGPGGVAGAYVHERHTGDQTLPKLLGWWGNNPATRFQMETVFDPVMTADSWQVSNGPVFQMASLRASLDVFDRAGGIQALRQKSELQIRYLDRLLAERVSDRITNITPTELDARGCQSALCIDNGDGRQVFEGLERARVFCDWREPNVIRVAPVPLYNSFDDIDRFVDIIDRLTR